MYPCRAASAFSVHRTLSRDASGRNPSLPERTDDKDILSLLAQQKAQEKQAAAADQRAEDKKPAAVKKEPVSASS